MTGTSGRVSNYGTKRYFPGAPRYDGREFLSAYGRWKGKIKYLQKQIRKLDLSPKVKLGSQLFSSVTNIKSELHDRTIYPRFFAEALDVIVANSRFLDPHIKVVQLNRLGYKSIKTALKKRIISEDDIGKDFSLFSQKGWALQIDILIKLGVLRLLPKISFQDIYDEKAKTIKNPKPIVGPRPPIKYVYLREKPSRKDHRQLSFPGLSKDSDE